MINHQDFRRPCRVQIEQEPTSWKARLWPFGKTYKTVFEGQIRELNSDRARTLLTVEQEHEDLRSMLMSGPGGLETWTSPTGQPGTWTRRGTPEELAGE